MKTSRYDISEIKRRVSLLDLAARLLPDLKKYGTEYKARCPFHQEKTPSFAINERKGVFFCYGCRTGGDAIKFYALYHDISWKDAIAELARHAGIEAGPSRQLQPRKTIPPAVDLTEKRKHELDYRRCVEIWAKSEKADGTLVESYLCQRGIDCASFGGVPSSLKFHPGLDIAEPPYSNAPAMVGLIKNIQGALIGLHRTYLTSDGKKAPINAPKKMLGRHHGGAVRLTAATRRMAIAEGIETGLSALYALRHAGDEEISVWAALSLQNVVGGADERTSERRRYHATRKLANGARQPLPVMAPDMARPGILLPDEVEEVVILADNDGDRETTEALLVRAQRRWHAMGKRVSIAWPPQGMDVNDWLLSSRSGKDPAWPSNISFEDARPTDGVVGQMRGFARQEFRVPK